MFKKGRRIIKRILLILIVFLICSLVVLPAFQKGISEAEMTNTSIYPKNLGKSNERVLCIDNNVDALKWRLRIIEEAKENLIFTTFSFVDDESGTDIMSALHAAAERGVHVKILVDGVSNFLYLTDSDCFRALSTTNNVEVKIYNPIDLAKLWRVNYRMHDKYIIADNTVYMLGGRNTKNLSLGDYQDKMDIDRDLVVYGSDNNPGRSLFQVKAYFDRVWNLEATEKYNHPISSDVERATASNKLSLHYEELKKKYKDAFTKTDWEKSTAETNGVLLLTNEIEAENKAPVLWKDLINIMENGKSVIAQTPYIMCNEMMYTDLASVANKTESFDIITNSVETGANICGTADYMNQKDNIYSIGADLCEYFGDKSTHTKSIVVDDNISVIGSFNFDMRSAYLDTEMMLVVDSEGLNKHLRELDKGYMENSRQILADGAGTLIPNGLVEQELNFGEKIVKDVLRVVTIPLRHLL